MKNRLQFNRHFALYETREEAINAFNNRITDPDFIPLIGEPIVLRYKDENGKVQLILAVGKKAGRSLQDREYHLIDTAELDEKIAAEIAAREELDAETIKKIVFDGVESEFSDNVATISVSANSIPIGEYEDYHGRAVKPHPIHDEYSVLDAIKQLDLNFIDFTEKEAEKISGLHIVRVTEDLPANIKEAYDFVNKDGQVQPESDRILIYKDSALYKVYLGHVDDRLVSYEDPTVIDGTGDAALCFIYQRIDGLYELVAVNVEAFLEETEFKDGLDVNNHEVKVKIDPTSENFLTVGPDGVNLSGVQDAIDTARQAEEDRAVAAEEAIQAELDATQVGAGLSGNGAYIHDHPTNYIDVATSLANADHLLDAALADLSANTSAATTSLDSKIDELSANTMAADEVLDNKIEELSANTMAADASLDNKIEELSANTMAADQALQDNIDTLDNKILALSAGTESEVTKLDNKIDELSANTMAADEVLDNKIDELSANTMAADQALRDSIDELDGRNVLGVSAITTETLANGDTKVSLLINDVQNDKVLTQSQYGLMANVSLVYSSSDTKIYLKGKNDVVISEIDAKDFIKDGMITSVTTITPTQEWIDAHPEYGYANLEAGVPYLWITFNVDSPQSPKDIFIRLDSLVDIYTVASGSSTYMTINDYVIGLNVDQVDGLASYNYARNISAVTDNIISACGLNIAGQGGTYPSHDETHFIKNAGSLDQADVLLDGAVWAVSGAVGGLYTEITQLSGNTDAAIDRLSAYTYYTIQQLSGGTVHDIRELSGAVNTNETNIANLSGAVVSFSASTVQNIKDIYSAITYVSNSVSGIVSSSITVFSGVIIDYITSAISGVTIEVDDHIDSASTKPVENRAIYEYVSGIELVVSGAVNDITNLSAATVSLSNDVANLSAATVNIVTISGDVTSLSAATVNLSNDVTNLSAVTVNNVNNIVTISGDVISLSSATVSLSNDVTNLSAATVSLSAATVNIGNGLGDLSAATIDLSGAVMSISAKTSGVLTLNLNDVEQGKYSPSANTTINFDVTGANVLLSGYVLSSGITEEELAIVSSDTISNAFGKIQKQIYDDEIVISAAFNDIDGRILELSARTVDLSDYYTKEEVDRKIASGGTFDPTAYYTKTEVNNLISSVTIVDSARTSFSAVTSLSAQTSVSAITSLSARTSLSADTSLSAVTSLSAQTSLSAITSLSARTSLSAITSLSAQTSLSAVTAGRLDHDINIALSGECYGSATTNFEGNVLNVPTFKKFTTTNSLSNIAFAEYLTVITTGADATLTVAANANLPKLPAGGLKEAHVIISNTGSTGITVTVSQSDSRLKITGDNVILIDPSNFGELNALITYDGSAYTIYIITT